MKGMVSITANRPALITTIPVPCAIGQVIPPSVSKQPRVDVRHSDFAVGCPNAADPNGQQDSTCAIKAAVAFASAAEQRPSGTAPALYLPHGTYKISGD